MHLLTLEQAHNELRRILLLPDAKQRAKGWFGKFHDLPFYVHAAGFLMNAPAWDKAQADGYTIPLERVHKYAQHFSARFGEAVPEPTWFGSRAVFQWSNGKRVGFERCPPVKMTVYGDQADTTISVPLFRQMAKVEVDNLVDPVVTDQDRIALVCPKHRMPYMECGCKTQLEELAAIDQEKGSSAGREMAKQFTELMDHPITTGDQVPTKPPAKPCRECGAVTYADDLCGACVEELSSGKGSDPTPGPPPSPAAAGAGPQAQDSTPSPASTPAVPPAPQDTKPHHSPPDYLDAMRTVTSTPSLEDTPGPHPDEPAPSATGDDSGPSLKEALDQSLPSEWEDVVVAGDSEGVRRELAGITPDGDGDSDYGSALYDGEFVRAPSGAMCCVCAFTLDAGEGCWTVAVQGSTGSNHLFGHDECVHRGVKDYLTQEEEQAFQERAVARRNGVRCACGCAKSSHRADGTGRCSRCPCIEFRPAPKGQPAPAIDDGELSEEDQLVTAADMDNVRTQRTAKRYHQCRLCKSMIKGPKKDAAGKIKEKGEQWVSPDGKTRYRMHFRCADKRLEELKLTVGGS